jgi:uncharacterized membrane protein
MVPALSTGGQILLGIFLLAGGWALRRRGN